MKLSVKDTEYIFSDYFELKVFANLHKNNSSKSLEDIVSEICQHLSIETPQIVYCEYDPEFLAQYSNGEITVCDNEITIETLLHELAHHVSDCISIYKNEPEVINGNMTVFHGHGFVKALEKVVAIFNRKVN